MKLSNTKNIAPDICFGLLESDSKKSAFLGTFDMVYNENGGGDEITARRGGQLFSRNGSWKIGEKVLEFRVDLKQRILKIADYPEYSKVAEMKYAKNIKEKEEYYLGF